MKPQPVSCTCESTLLHAKVHVSILYPYHLLFCFGRASSHAVSIPFDMARQMNVLNLMLLSLIKVLRALIGWRI